MIIHELIMNGYGKFIQKKVTLKNGFNLVYGKNEAGKSTLQAFIKNMLFSFENKNTDSEGRIPDLKKYRPWSGDSYSGSLELSLDNDLYYKIERDFKDKTCRVFNKNLEDITSTFDFNKREGLQFGESLLKMDRNTFVNTALIKQDTTKVLKNDKQEIFDKIINLQETGEENLSVSKAIAALNKARVELGHKNTKNKTYNNVLEKISELKEKKLTAVAERQKVLEDQSRQTNIISEIKQLESEIRHLEQKVIEQENYQQLLKIHQDKERLEKKLEDYNRYENMIKSINDKIYDYEIKKSNHKILAGINESEIIEKLKEVSLLKNEYDSVKEENIVLLEEILLKKQRSKNLWAIICAIGLGISLLAAVFLSPYLFILSGVLFAALTVILAKKSDKALIEKISILKNQIADMNAEKKDLVDFIYQTGFKSEEDINKIEQTISEIFNVKSRLEKAENSIDIELNRKSDYEKIKEDILKETGFENSIQLSKKIYFLEDELKKSEFNKNDENDHADYRKILEETKVEKNNRLQELAGIKAILNKYWVEDNTLADLEEEIAGYQEKMDEILKSQKAIQYAMELLDLSAKDIKLDIIPKINQMMSENLSKITNKVHDNLMTGKDTELNTEYENKVRSIYEFSEGTIDQMYLSLRIAATDVFSQNERIPVILDEVFAFYDKERMSCSFELLSELSKEKQVILFTCKEDEKLLAQHFSEINIIEI
ncbi:MAG: AAA family ATPase [Clostridia bacterium]|nr:AAA family ATPase [Clostridia bacterium]